MEVELPSEPAPRRGVRLVDSLSVATGPCRGHMAPARWHHGCARDGAKIIAIHWMTAHRGHHRTPRRSGWLPERPNVHPVWVTALRKLRKVTEPCRSRKRSPGPSAAPPPATRSSRSGKCRSSMTSSPEVQAAVGDPARFGDLQKGREGILPDTRTANFVGKWPAGRPE